MQQELVAGSEGSNSFLISESSSIDSNFESFVESIYELWF